MAYSEKLDHGCYCAFCRSPKRTPGKRAIGVMNVIGSLFTSLVVMAILWQEFDPRVFIVFVICLAVAEVFVQLRWRMSLVCQKCGFDPVLYGKSPSAASEKVKEQLAKRKEDPKYLLSGRLNLPTITPERAEELQMIEKRGSVLSKTI